METEDCSVLDKWKFVSTAQRLAFVLDDMEMLSFATKLKLKKQEIFDASIEEDSSGSSFDYEMRTRTRQGAIATENTIRQPMEQCFYTNAELVPNMEPYQRCVESNKQYLIGIGRYQELSNYVDTHSSNKRIFNAVKKITSSQVGDDIGSKQLSEEDLKERFAKELPKFYARAERHLGTFIQG